ncbi:cytochrome P450 [Gigaspora rosea]|uniref:Cytochrome P450 n=1 Tax=Gigaspora rosea TaxID=44941 RepID=A0A397UJ46_9GLOM|nr:cytochrome P450 [Gigaspora rosea]
MYCFRNLMFFEFYRLTFPIADVFRKFTDSTPAHLARVVHEQISGKLNIYTPRMQKELVSGIEKFIGDCKERKVIRNIQVMLSRIIAKPVANVILGEDDLLDFFIGESEADAIDDKLLNHLFGVLYLIVFASISTTSRALSFALFDYGGRPELWNELYEEQLKIHNESNGYLNSEDVNKKKMINLDCFLKESFRHSSDIGRDVYLYMKDTAFNNKFFGETSNDFQPKRHITSYTNGKIIYSPATKVDRSFITFGGGKHACPELKVVKIVPIKMSSFKIPPIGGVFLLLKFY